MNCLNRAVFHIVTNRPNNRGGGPDHYSDDTYACVEHVGALLGWQQDTREPTGEIFWTVLQIEPIAPVPCCFIHHDTLALTRACLQDAFAIDRLLS